MSKTKRCPEKILQTDLYQIQFSIIYLSLILKFYLYQTYNLTSNAHTDYARRHCVSENEHKSNSNNRNKYVAFKQHNYCYAHLGHANISVGLLVAHLFLNSLVVIKLLAISVTQSHHATIAQTQCLYAYAMKENIKPMGSVSIL